MTNEADGRREEKEELALKLPFNQSASYPHVPNEHWNDYWEQVYWKLCLSWCKDSERY